MKRSPADEAAIQTEYQKNSYERSKRNFAPESFTGHPAGMVARNGRTGHPPGRTAPSLEMLS
jgi:hypothetical protein